MSPTTNAPGADEASTGARLRVLAAGMLPPPLGGQAMMFETAVQSLDGYAEVTTIDLQVQDNIGESGLLSTRKLLKFANIISAIVRKAVFGKSFDVLYYCPAGPSKIGIIKDIICLAMLRPRCRRTIYHFHATGGMKYLLGLNDSIVKLAKKTIWRPDVAIRCAEVEPNDAEICEARETRIVRNGIPDPAKLFPEGCEWTQPEKLSLTFIGAMTEEKGIFDVVEIAHHLHQLGLDFEVRMIGEGTEDEIAKFDALVAHHGLEGYIDRLGIKRGREKFGILRSSTFLVFPTFFRAETQPLVVIEALAMGVPAMVSDWRGLRSIVTDGETGFVYPPHDTKAMADRIALAHASGELPAMSCAARKAFIERFDLSVFENAMRTILTQSR
ncbi:glycosyltransferase family 4 protein [Novosphingobium decolorationis]|uniref:Glycosyltransferase n=1 Tax=Novosphingobium decolorationis TaxID=2698673 RepID=A0ABX8E670_9SPHN|nr:glycosyltransferase [Novosphingobium decolorationis]QVM83711.1 glycosyltransferase [Novosphingobium decolorationis]